MKTVFFFGSGADTQANKNLTSGAEFNKSLLLNKYTGECKSILGDEFSNCNCALLYPTSNKVYIQTIIENEYQAKKVFEKDDVEIIKKYSEGTEKYENVKDYFSSWYKIIAEKKKEDLNEHEEKEKEFFLNNCVFFDSLDEKFNSLKNNNLNSNAKRVINAYYTVFIMMMKSVYNLQKDSFNWTLPSIFKRLNEKYDAQISDSNYYNLLEKYNFSDDNCYVVTTNYTDYAKDLTGISNTIYLHGKLTWFEDRQNLSVFDVTKKDETDTILEELNLSPKKTKDIFPFIMIPSGVKPIICKKQINEFSKFCKALDEADKLVVVGYKFNKEDNHINSIIHEWLESSKNNKLYFLNYKKENSLDLLWLKNIHSKPENQLFTVDVNPDSSLKEFERLCKKFSTGETL